MPAALIGHTGFVGSNLDRQFTFDGRYNSSNIAEIRNKKFDLVICAGIKAEKWLANKHPEEDLRQILNLIENLKQVKAAKFVHISTVDVYENPVGVDEYTLIDPNGGHPYGRNRFHAEKMLKNVFDDILIIRLPALFGKGLKKNFIFDLLNPIPRVIMPDKFKEIRKNLNPEDINFLESCYSLNTHLNLVQGLNKDTLERLLAILKKAGFTSLNFTHRESVFQYYPLANLRKDIEFAIQQNINLLNLVTEPISSHELAKEVFGLEFFNATGKPPVYYDIKTIHHHHWKHDDGYVYSKDQILGWLKDYRRDFKP